MFLPAFLVPKKSCCVLLRIQTVSDCKRDGAGLLYLGRTDARTYAQIAYERISSVCVSCLALTCAYERNTNARKLQYNKSRLFGREEKEGSLLRIVACIYVRMYDMGVSWKLVKLLARAGSCSSIVGSIRQRYGNNWKARMQVIYLWKCSFTFYYFFYLHPIIMIIWSIIKMSQLGLEESSEVEGFGRPKYTEIKAERTI